jgi:hypothetical protein
MLSADIIDSSLLGGIFFTFRGGDYDGEEIRVPAEVGEWEWRLRRKAAIQWTNCRLHEFRAIDSFAEFHRYRLDWSTRVATLID